MTDETLKKKKTETLRSMAKDANVKDWKTLERAELIAALSGVSKEDAPVEETEEPDEKPNDILEEATQESEEGVLLQPGMVVEVNAPGPGSKPAAMKAKLMSQPKVMIMIPMGPKEKRGSTESVILNGYRLNITKGM